MLASDDRRNTNHNLIKNMKPIHKGLSIALTIIGLWILSLTTLLTRDVAQIQIGIIPVCVLCQMFLYTGLFITAHDAMHGTVCPARPRLNNIIGTVAVRLYALFEYRNLLAKHWAHHKTPASGTDPDFHDGTHSGFLAWYFHFMKTYLGWKQIVGMALVFQIMEYVLGIPTVNLLLFWVLPSWLSTLQLFYFGTYLPHRLPEGGYDNRHRAQSNVYSTFWSFITCYHFGYHWEHHEYPYVPWWELPKTRKMPLQEDKNSLPHKNAPT